MVIRDVKWTKSCNKVQIYHRNTAGVYAHINNAGLDWHVMFDWGKRVEGGAEKYLDTENCSIWTKLKQHEGCRQ